MPLLQSYFDVMDRIVEDHGGRVDKHIGDGVMGVFGAPVAHGNDVERAARTASDSERDGRASPAAAGRSASMSASRPARWSPAAPAATAIANTPSPANR